MRLIDADAVIPKGTKVTDDVIAVHNALAKAPTIDAVEVVRCMDCKNAKQHPIFPFSRRCKIEDYRLPHRADHFCSYGERRAEDA